MPRKSPLYMTGLFSMGHLLTDFYTNFLPVLIPVLIVQFDMSLTMSGALVLCLSIGSNTLQLVFGDLQDRYDLSPMLYFIVPLGALAMCLVGYTESTAVLFLLVFLNGVAVAAYHPLGSELTARQANEKSGGRLMSYYLSSGNLGYALAPLAMVWFMEAFPLTLMPIMVLPSLLLCWEFYRHRDVGYDTRRGGRKQSGLSLSILKKNKPLLTLNAAMGLRSWTHLALATYLPLLLIGRGVEETTAGALLSFFLVGSVAGSLTGGMISERLGHKRTAAVLLSLSLIPTIIFYLSDGLNALTLAALFLIAFCLLGAQPSSVIWAQRLFPGHEGVAASMMMGLSFFIGSLGVLITSALADLLGLETALLLTIIPAALSALFAWRTPER